LQMFKYIKILSKNLVGMQDDWDEKRFFG
jgi:hypothetical protein